MEGFITAPSGITPSMTNRHRAISSLRARATTITFANTAAGRADPIAEPSHLRGARLVALPKPCQLDLHRSEPSVTCLPDALLAVDSSAAIRSRSKAGI